MSDIPNKRDMKKKESNKFHRILSKVKARMTSLPLGVIEPFIAGEPEVSLLSVHFYTSTKSWSGNIFTSVCVSVCVCLSGSACEQNFSRTDEPIWTQFFAKWLLTALAQTLLK